MCVSLDAVFGLISTVLPITWYQICMSGRWNNSSRPTYFLCVACLCVCVCVWASMCLAVQLQVSLALSSWHTDVVVGTYAGAHTHTHYEHCSRKSQYPEIDVAKCMRAPRSWCCQSTQSLVVVRRDMVQPAGFTLPDDYNVDSSFYSTRLRPRTTLQNKFIIGPLLCSSLDMSPAFCWVKSDWQTETLTVHEG